MLTGWTFEDHGGGVVYVRAPSGKHVALGYLIGSEFTERDHILRELIISVLGVPGAKSRYGIGGLQGRFIIERADGMPIDPSRRYSLVLDFSGADPHAIVAAKAYADSVEAENPQLAHEIRRAVGDPSEAPPQHRYA